MKRRKFLNWLGISSLTAWLTTTIASCVKTETEENITSSSLPIDNDGETIASTSLPKVDQDGFMEVGTIEELEKKGRILLPQNDQEPVLIVKESVDSTQVFALSSLCTHQGCNVDWNVDRQEFFCPCHGSTFKADGTVISGQAEEPLPAFPTKIEGKTILVKL